MKSEPYLIQLLFSLTAGFAPISKQTSTSLSEDETGYLYHENNHLFSYFALSTPLLQLLLSSKYTPNECLCSPTLLFFLI